MAIVRVTAKGYIPIPKPLREKYGIRPATKISVTETEGGVRLTPITREYISSMRGILSGIGPDFEERMRWKNEDLEKE